MDNKEKQGEFKVINIGLNRFYEALINQNIKAVQLEWAPPVKQSEEISNLLDEFM